MDNTNNDSGVNTVLLVLVLLIIVGFGVWWFTMRNSVTTPPANNSSGINLDVNLPDGNNGASDTDSTAPSTNDANQ